jgi:hypothetical protein
MAGDTRDLFRRVADTLFPGSAKLPLASDVDTHGTLLDRAIAAHPAMGAAAESAVRELGNEQEMTISTLKDTAADGRDDLVTILTAAYYMSRTVRTALGYPGQGRNPLALADDDELVSDDLLAPVTERGHIYVKAPE